MRKFIVCALALLVLMLAATPALAGVGDEMYATKDGVKVYLEPDKDSEVVLRLEKGESVHVMEESDNGKWYGYYPPDDSMGLCWVQEKYLSDEMPHDHEWSDWEIEEEPTCTHEGLRVRYCEICGAEQEDTIDKLDHEYGKWTVTREPTCTHEGERTRTCEVCGHEQTQTLDKLDHEYGKWTVVREADCQHEGERTRTCKVCGYEQTQTLDKTDHDYGPWEIAVEATDHSAGERSRTCQVCGHEQTEAYDPDGTLRRKDRGEDVRRLQQLLVDQGYLKNSGADGIFGGSTETAVKKFQLDQGLEPDGVAWPQTQKRLDHDFGPWTVTAPLTRDADGQRTRTCVDCGYQETEPIPAHPRFARWDRGEDVRTLQNMLNDLGYNAGRADDIYGDKLDNAFAALAEDAGFDFAAGSVLPSEIDSLTNHWIAAQPELWKGMGDKDSPVELALTVTPREAEGPVRDFDWTLTNLGGAGCSFKALLLGFGETHDFAKDNYVMVLNNADLGPNGGNTLSGSFTASADWDATGAKYFSFAALAVADADGARWLSNAIILPIE